MVRFTDTYVGDFETTVFDGQTFTEVWASALVKMHTEDVKIHHSIDDTFSFLCSLNKNVVVYYHNLKFDGSFWLSFLLTKTDLKEARILTGETETSFTYCETDKMPNNTFKYVISDMGQWYSITIKYHNHYIEVRDSLKLLPFPLRKIGKDFKTKHQKLEMEYTGFRFAGCEITDEEKEYISNDVLVIKEALEIMFEEGHKKLTIGSCCLAEFRSEYRDRKSEYEYLFPDLTKITLNEEKYGSKDVDEYVRKSYKGGWCYLVPSKAEKLFSNGTTADVNSLYPSMMHSESGNVYPVGKPTFWKGNYIHPLAVKKNEETGLYPYYFVRIKTEFRIKENKLPCIQIKNNPCYLSTQWLETSDVCLKERTIGKKKFTKKVMKNPVILTLTMTDFELINEHYDLINLEILDGCFFETRIGLFDRYINKYKAIKISSTGARKAIAKLFLNNLYGKFASSRVSSFKYAEIKEDNSLSYSTQVEFNKKTMYIPIGSAITSYARNFTIRTAQMNYYGEDKDGFIYADTDSIHCNISADKIKGIKVHESDFCCWKLEASWDKGWFVRQKTYIEHVTHEDLKPIEEPYYNIKCAGMNDKAKHFYQISMLDDVDKWIAENKKEYNKMANEEKEYIKEHRTIEDFKTGFIGVGKLIPRNIKGGVILCNTLFTLR